MAYLGSLVFLVAPWARSSAGAGAWPTRAGTRWAAVAMIPAAVPRRARRLGADRGGAPAVDRAGPAEDRRRAVTQRLDADARRHPRRVRALYVALGVADFVLMRRYARPDRGCRWRRRRRRDRSRAARVGAARSDVVSLETFWFCLIARPLGRLLRARGLRLRRRHAAAVRAATASATAHLLSSRSARSGTATRSGWWSRRARPSPRSRRGTRRCSRASTSRCCSSSSC